MLSGVLCLFSKHVFLRGSKERGHQICWHRHWGSVIGASTLSLSTVLCLEERAGKVVSTLLIE